MFAVTFAAMLALLLFRALGGNQSTGHLLLSVLQISLLVAGLVTYVRMRRDADVSILSLMRRWAPLILVACVAGVVVLYLILVSMYDPSRLLSIAGPLGAVATGLVLGGVLFIVLITILVWDIILCFGIIGIMSEVMGRYVPGALLDMSKGDSSGRVGRLLRWFLRVPAVLDVTTLQIGPARFGSIKRQAAEALLWQIVFGTVVLLYISLNPLIGMEPVELIAMISSLTVLIPLLVLPWSPIEATRARIDAPLRPFTLYEGIRSRVSSIIGIVGTIIIFVRLAFKRVDMVELFAQFSSFYLFFIILSVVSTVVYFNYFHRRLTEGICEGYAELSG